MGQVLIRNIDDKVLKRLKRRATAQQKSLEQSLRDVLTEAARPSRAELLSEADRIAAMTPPREEGKTYPTAEELVRESPGLPVTLVVDASVALKWFLVDEPYRAEARAVLGSGEALIAPDLIVPETCNAAWRGVRVGRMRQDQAEEMARSLPGMIDGLIAGSVLAEQAIIIACQLDHAVYDCFYAALAEAHDASLVTADARFLAKLVGTPWSARVRSLAEYRPPA